MRRTYIRLLIAALLALGLVGLRPSLTLGATTVSDCPTTESALRTDIAAAGPGGAVLFTCTSPTTIPFTSHVNIQQSVTLDASSASGSVTLDGGSKTQLFYVIQGVTLTLNTLTLARGSSTGASGGAIFNFGTVSITDSTLSGNYAAYNGGAIENYEGTASISSSTLSGNWAGIHGAGGICANCTGGAINTFYGTVRIADSTLSGNSATYAGGAIYDAYGTVRITSSTLSGDSVPSSSGRGGAIYNDHGALTITSSTLSGDTVPSSYFAKAGAIYNSGTANVGGSIIANNGGGNCFGALTDQGYDLTDGNGTCGLIGPTDLTGKDPLLGPLQNNGGPTQTMALLTGSPAIDAGPSGAGCSATDQRGLPRPLGSACDIGAYEANLQVHVSFTPPPGQAGYFNASDSPATGTVTAASLTQSSVSSITCTVNGHPLSLSGSSITIPTSVQQEGSNSVQCSATDSAGFAGGGAAAVLIDTQGPSIRNTANTCSLPVTNGWCRGNETSTFSYQDATSGMAAPCVAPPGAICTHQVTSTTEGSSVTVSSGPAIDAAGNPTPAINSNPFRVDHTPPTGVTATPDRAPNANGWYNRPVTVSAPKATDALSGLGWCSSPTWSGPETNLGGLTVTCTDMAGNSASASYTLRYDTTAPTANPGIASGRPGANGWYISPVTIAWNWSDTLSGVDPAHCPASTTSNGQGTLTLSTSCQDFAGNTGTASKTVKVDTTPPTGVTATPDRAPNANGWYNRPVTVSAPKATDALSGLTSCTSPTYSGPDSAAASLTVTCTDQAGNTASATYHFQYDATKPSITAVLSPASPAGTGWYNRSTGAPTVRFSCSDATSGIAGSCPAPYTFPEGANESHSAMVWDRAGNSSSAGVSGIKVDLTAPVITYSGNASSYTVDQQVSISCSASDPLSGVTATGCKPVSGPAYSFGLGSHTFSATATDRAGNLGSGSTSFVVKDTVAGLSAITKQYFTAQPTIASSLCTLLRQGKFAGYIALVHAYSLSQYHLITPAHAALLIQLAQALSS